MITASRNSRRKSVGQFIIEASNIRKKYDDKTVLKDISLQAQRGEAVGLVGVNGCGKKHAAADSGRPQQSIPLEK